MQSSDAHLERALREYNDRITVLESEEPSQELIDAYVKRGRILDLLDYHTSAIDDFEEAIDLIREMESSKQAVSPDVCFRAYAAMGSALANEEDDAPMLESYAYASGYLSKLTDPVSAARTCITVGDDLINAGQYMSARMFLKSALCLREEKDEKSKNLFVTALFLLGTIHLDAERFDDSNPLFAEAVQVGSDLLEKGKLDDVLLLILCYVYLSDGLIARGDYEAASANLAVACMLLEDKESICAVDGGVLSDLFGHVGKNYITMGKPEIADRYLLRQAAFSLGGDDPGVREAIEGSLFRGTDE